MEMARSKLESGSLASNCRGVGLGDRAHPEHLQGQGAVLSERTRLESSSCPFTVLPARPPACDSGGVRTFEGQAGQAGEETKWRGQAALAQLGNPVGREVELAPSLLSLLFSLCPVMTPPWTH